MSEFQMWIVIIILLILPFIVGGEGRSIMQCVQLLVDDDDDQDN